MKTAIQEKIYKIIQKIEEFKAIKRHYDSTEEALISAEKELQALDRQLDKELKDIDKLEGVSIKSLFHKVLGSKEEQVEKERQEYLSLSLKHKELAKDIEVFEFELEVLKKKIKDISVLEGELKLLKKKRMNEILTTDSGERSALEKTYGDLDSLSRIEAEMKEAFLAGQHAIKEVDVVIKYLREAEKWGNWDRMSNNRHYDNRKYNAIDKAVNHSHYAKKALLFLQRELADINVKFDDTRIHIDGFGGFMDRLFDNMITDWMVQNKINNTLHSVQSTRDKVVRVMQMLESEKKGVAKKVNDLESKIDQILTA